MDRRSADSTGFYVELQRQGSVEACAALFQAAIAPFGFVAAACRRDRPRGPRPQRPLFRRLAAGVAALLHRAGLRPPRPAHQCAQSLPQPVHFPRHRARSALFQHGAGNAAPGRRAGLGTRPPRQFARTTPGSRTTGHEFPADRKKFPADRKKFRASSTKIPCLLQRVRTAILAQPLQMS